MAVDRDRLKKTLDSELNSAAFSDYCPNGLQVEGSAHISRLVSGVTASQALIDRAVELDADAILVHHGYFWRGEDPCLVGMKGRRVSALVRANIRRTHSADSTIPHTSFRRYSSPLSESASSLFDMVSKL